MDGLLAKHWHHLPREEVANLLDSDSIKGLDSLEAEHRKNQYGPNRLTPQKGKSPLLLFLLQFHQPLIYILLVAGTVTLLLQEWVDSGVIFGVVLVNAIIGFIQEIKAIRAINALANAIEGSATVVRAGKKTRIPTADVVPGDLVFLQSGDRVPADLRLIHSRELQINESSLTGESLPVQKHAEALVKDTELADRCNMAYSSTLVTFGTGTGFVVATGDGTEIGRINTLIAGADTLATPLTRKIAHFSSILLWIILALAGLTVVAGQIHGEPLFDTFMAAVALAVGAIPEGLPAAMTIMLAIGVSKMARRHAIIRHMPAVETLGSTTVICSDKTGTLTQNQMTVQAIFAGNRCYEVTGVGYAPVGEILLDGASTDIHHHPALKECLKAGVLCNDSQLSEHNGAWLVEGDPTEVALITAACKAGIHLDDLQQELRHHDTLPFESQHQYMATLFGGDNHGVIYIKGSVEQVLQRCRTCYGDDHPVPLDSALLHARAESMANDGLRVLAFARKCLPPGQTTVDHPDMADDLEFLGLQAMIDPPRPEAIAAVKTCQQAGIQVKMITGDHLVTACAIARQMGLIESHEAEQDLAYNGSQLSQMDDTEFTRVAAHARVFARVAPEQKLRLVKALQARGDVVAMTGDGVNDAPALKQADIGVAMGAGGTEVAKEAADMVLTNDNFSTIEAAVEEGRTVFDNLIKFITWTLPTNLGEGLVIMVAILAGVTLPITPVQILWINMTTAVLLGLMLAFEHREPGIMSRPPRRPDTPVITGELAFRIVSVSLMLLIGAFGLFYWAIQQQRDLQEARTLAANMFVFGELFYLFNCRSLRYSMFRLGVFSNPWLLFGVTLMVLLQLAFTYLPVMNHLFGTRPLAFSQWLMVLAGGLAIYLLVGLEKWIRYGRHSHNG